MKSSKWIKLQVKKNNMLEPFIPYSVRDGVISYGLGPYGYDIRLDKTYKRLNSGKQVLDPFRVSENDYQTLTGNTIIIEAGSFILGRSVEFFRMPLKVIGLVFGKSTYARSGIFVNITPLEPEWSGFLTISISNVSDRPAVVYPMQGIAQVIFFESDKLPLFSYKELKGKYNDQKDITPSKIQ